MIHFLWGPGLFSEDHLYKVGPEPIVRAVGAPNSLKKGVISYNPSYPIYLFSAIYGGLQLHL